MKKLKVIVEKRPDCFVAYPLGMSGVVVGQGESYDEAVEDATSAIRFHLETFGDDALDTESPVLDVRIADAEIAA